MKSEHTGAVDASMDPSSDGVESTSRISSGRRRLLKGTVALTGGVISASYVQPTLRSFGSAVALAVGSTPTVNVKDKDKDKDKKPK